MQVLTPSLHNNLQKRLQELKPLEVVSEALEQDATLLRQFSCLPSKSIFFSGIICVLQFFSYRHKTVGSFVYVRVLFVFRVGADVDVSIEDVSLSGRVQIVFEMDHLVPFPHMKSVSVTFLEK